MIEVFHLTKVYKGGVKALDDLTFSSSVKRLTLLGNNGAGKTTLVRILSTQLLPTSGIARVEGYDVVKDAKKLRKIISSIPQEAQPVGIASPLEHVVMYLTARGFSFKDAYESARKALKEVNLWEFKDKPADELSGGMKRKIFVAMALASNAEVIFLDEPTVGLDPLSRMEVWSIIRSIPSKVILTTHYMEEAEELSEEIVMLRKGKVILKGNLKELLGKFKDMVRVEGIGDLKVGLMNIMYINREEAAKYVGKYPIKPVTLEDLFIIYAGENLES
ncbi:MAG: ABC transporter ATP-binding protein [Sulfolobaceae archaeon]|nr:ABC transporter ATP-binding protein [Sulfolobaceae archaeon]